MNTANLHTNTVRVYAEDVDYMGIVYHSNHLCYLERSRTEFLRSHDLVLSQLAEENALFAVTDLSVKYLSPAKLDDLLTVTTEIKELSYCKVTFEQKIINEFGALICVATVIIVCVNNELKPQLFPNRIRALRGILSQSQAN